MMIDVVIPTWNSMPSFEKTLSSLNGALGDALHDVIVVDRESNDGTLETARKYGCRILTDTESLGSARLAGLHAASASWIAWIDSDIVLPEGWFDNIMSYVKPGVGWIFGRTIPDDPIFRDFKLKKMAEELDGPCVLSYAERAFTNNSVCLRDPLLEVDEEKLCSMNAFEDNLLSMTIQKQGYKVLKVPVPCTHIGRHSGVWRFGWNTSGYIHLHGRDSSRLLHGLYPVKHGIEMAMQYGDFRLLREGMQGVMIHLLTFVWPGLFYEVER